MKHAESQSICIIKIEIPALYCKTSAFSARNKYAEHSRLSSFVRQKRRSWYIYVNEFSPRRALDENFVWNLKNSTKNVKVELFV